MVKNIIAILIFYFFTNALLGIENIGNISYIQNQANDPESIVSDNLQDDSNKSNDQIKYTDISKDIDNINKDISKLNKRLKYVICILFPINIILLGFLIFYFTRRVITYKKKKDLREHKKEINNEDVINIANKDYYEINNALSGIQMAIRELIDQRKAWPSKMDESKKEHLEPDTKYQKQNIIELYNEARNDQFKRDDFNSSYEILSIEVVNYNERYLDPQLDPIFKEIKGGYYIAIRYDKNNPNEIMVFPRFDLTIQEALYTWGAMGMVFQFDPYFDTSSSYSNYTVKKPAIFSKVFHEWELKQKGEIELGSKD